MTTKYPEQVKPTPCGEGLGCPPADTMAKHTHAEEEGLTWSPLLVQYGQAQPGPHCPWSTARCTHAGVNLVPTASSPPWSTARRTHAEEEGCQCMMQFNIVWSTRQ